MFWFWNSTTRKGEQLIEAAKNNNVAKAREIVNSSDDVTAVLNYADEDGWTPVYWASVRGHVGVVQCLCEAKADINAADKDGKSPVDVARDKQHVKVVELLEKAVKADLEARLAQAQDALAQVKAVMDGSKIYFLKTPACHVLQEYLQKPYQNPKGFADDDPLQVEVEGKCHAIPRHNHGIVHVLRQASLVPVAADFLFQNPPFGTAEEFSFTAPQLRGMQLVCLFMAIGRENEAGSPQEDPAITRFWVESATALVRFLDDNKWLDQELFAIPSELHSQDIWADSNSAAQLVKYLCHNLDVFRCDGSALEAMPSRFYGLTRSAPLVRYVQACLEATGDRDFLQGRTEYNPDLFLKCSTSVTECMQALDKVHVPKELRGPNFQCLLNDGMQWGEVKDKGDPLSVKALKDKEINSKELEINVNAEVYQGSYGTITQGTYKGQRVAIKRMKEKESERAKESICKEAAFLASLAHDNVISIRGVCTDEKSEDANGQQLGLCLLMPWKDSTLQQQGPGLKLVDKVKILMNLAYGMDYLHTRKPPVLHRDLKAANILMKNPDDVCIADFGLALSDDESAGVAGSAPWMAPELIEDKPFTTCCDVYSFGMLMLELFTGETPWGYLAESAIFAQLEKQHRPEIPQKMPESYRSIMERCWAQDSHARPVFGDVAQDLKQVLHEIQQTQSVGSTLQFAKHLPCKLPPLVEKSLQWNASSQYNLQVAEAKWDGSAQQSVTNFVERLVAKAGFSSVLSLPLWHSLRAATMLLHKPTRYNSFVAHVQQLNRRYDKLQEGPFKPNWMQPELQRSSGVVLQQTAEQIEWRKNILDQTSRIENLCAGKFHFPNTQLRLMFHATSSKDIALKICSTGFASLATTDAGYYGQGIYFTPNLDYATSCYGENVLVCAVLTGNSYPVIESPDEPNDLLGKPVVPKYDSHIVVVDKLQNSQKPLPPGKWGSNMEHAWVELVVFETSHILPLFLLEFPL